MKNKNSWNIQPSKFAMQSINPIRKIVENLHPNPNKSLISLSIGDPTVFGNLKAPQQVLQALTESANSMKFNGYLPSNGHPSARQAVARYSSTVNDHIQPNDVFITSGCSHALDVCISLLAESGQNILIPRPGFLLYQTLAHGYGVETKFYDLIPEQDFEIDLQSLEAAIDQNTAAIIYNNPSNPCGTVYRVEHMKKILQIAQKHCLPIIADEIYEHMVFPGHKFIPLASISDQVPILSCRGTTKRFLIPGYRVGWVIVHDRQNRFGNNIRMGLANICQRILGANSIVQGALPSILQNTPQSFYDETIQTIKENADIAFELISKIPGLRPYRPNAAMYMMISIDMQLYSEFKNDMEFIECLLAEQSVFCLPGKCFGVQNLMRIVLTLPQHLTHEAMDRIAVFCRDHLRPVPLAVNISMEIHLNAQNKENVITANGKSPLKKLSTAGLNTILTSNLANLLSNDPEEAEMLMQTYQK